MSKSKLKTDNDRKESYFDYLTKRLDNGESKNIAVFETIKILKEKLTKEKIVKILDIGCFSGAMLNRILIGLSQNERKRVKAVGLDFDKEVMLKGSGKYKDIIFVYGHIEKELPFIKQFDVILLSNVLHEVAPTKNISSRKKQIKKVFHNIIDLLVTNGMIIILDGCKPNLNKNVTLRFTNKKDKNSYIEFSKKYKAFKINCIESGDEIKTNQISLTAFLTKGRYMKKDYWENESSQTYQYFKETDFFEMFKKNNLKLVKSKPQYFSKDHLKHLFKSIKPQIQTPSKNILLIARK